MSLDSSQLAVRATGGVISHQIDFLSSHDGTDGKTFSDYDLETAPSNLAISLTTGTIGSFDFNVGFHSTSGDNPYRSSGANSTNFAVAAASQDLLATLNFEIDTAQLRSGTVDLSPSIFSASRGGLLGSSILNEVSVLPATSPWEKSFHELFPSKNLRFSRELRSRHLLHEVQQAVRPQPATLNMTAVPELSSAPVPAAVTAFNLRRETHTNTDTSVVDHPFGISCFLQLGTCFLIF